MLPPLPFEAHSKSDSGSLDFDHDALNSGRLFELKIMSESSNKSPDTNGIIQGKSVFSREDENMHSMHTFDTKSGRFTATVDGRFASLKAHQFNALELPIILTLHDIGLNHNLCFSSLFETFKSTPQLSQLPVIHLDIPGHQVGDENLSLEAHFDFSSLIDSIEHVRRELRLTNIIGIGVGAGASLLASYTSRFQSHVQGLIIVNAAARALSMSSWISSQAQKVSTAFLPRSSTTDNYSDFFLKRWFSQESFFTKPSLINYCSLLLERLNHNNVRQFVEAFKKRPDITSELSQISCPVLLVTGESSQSDEAIHLQSHIKPHLCEWIEVPNCAVLITLENPVALLASVKLFVQGLGIH